MTTIAAMPSPRGPQSRRVLEALLRPAGSPLRAVEPADLDDAQLSLWATQQLAYRRLPGVDPAWEDEPSLHALRHRLELDMEQDLRRRLALPDVDPSRVPSALTDLIDGTGGPSLSTWVEHHGTFDELREFAAHRAAYQLQEADPHSFAIPRLEPGRCKAALLQIQMDEYGQTDHTGAHAVLFADTMRALDLEPVADIDRLPAVTLATNTLLNLLGRSRRLVGALIGHLAVFEMTSVEPMSRYAAAMRRLLPASRAPDAARFYDVHVVADERHARIAAEELIGGFVAEHPDEAQNVLFGAAAVMHVESELTRHLLEHWDRGESSLRTPLPGSGYASRIDRRPLPLVSAG